MQVSINNTVLELTEGDITEAETEAIVNPANEALVLGAGAWFNVTDAFRLYLRPLLGSGMPDAYRLRQNLVPKVLKP